jgi:hypothetical protein
MKKIISSSLITATFVGLILSGCKNEEPKQPPVKETSSKSIQAATDQAHAVIDKTATTSQALTERANEIKDAARKAATDMSAAIQQSSPQVTEKTTEPQPTPAETHK